MKLAIGFSAQGTTSGARDATFDGIAFQSSGIARFAGKCSAFPLALA